ncbi:uncharacterized protein LOC130790582 [Actinidia eriantha]|uniref:uncharacterized protein LOC130790582 n=1 Tax=Actinidia eriantha TaxID=165200 RepID=UPI00258689FA|nr:uncharacterized protein LOC130790582 [Actinidia eriantha]
MLLQDWRFSGVLLCQRSPNCGCRSNIICYSRLLRAKPSSTTTCSSSRVVCASVGMDEIAQIAQNKVVISAALSAAIGQLSKPFTSAFLYGKTTTDNNYSFHFKAAFQAGGFPSTHSSAVVATAMSLGLERGFSDAVFGLAVVYASLVMYDAQGVRREVGIHAKALNRILLQNLVPSDDADDLIDSRPRKSSSNCESFEPLFLEEVNSLSTKKANAKLLLRSEKRKGQNGILISSSLASDVPGKPEEVAKECVGDDEIEVVAVLKESVGHNEIEVVAGALLGLFVCLAVYTTT